MSINTGKVKKDAIKLFTDLFVGQTIKAFGEDSDCLWANQPKELSFKVVEVDVPYVAEEGYKGFISVNMRLQDYDEEKIGSVYTDTKFLKNVRDIVEQANLNPDSINYSEYGLQGKDYVNFDVSYAELIAKKTPKKSIKP